MERVFQSHAPMRRAGWLALIGLPFIMAQTSSAQDQTASAAAGQPLLEQTSVLPDPEIIPEAEFEEQFAPFDEEPPLFDPDDAPKAVDITEIDPPIEESQVIRELGTGHASYYGKRFHGRLTANGERFDMNAMTAAHRTLPFGSLVKVTNPRNGLSVVVRINDRGPFIKGRVIDLSRAAAQSIGMIRRGHARVTMDLVKS